MGVTAALSDIAHLEKTNLQDTPAANTGTEGGGGGACSGTTFNAWIAGLLLESGLVSLHFNRFLSPVLPWESSIAGSISAADRAPLEA
jgi:hypothetical protein